MTPPEYILHSCEAQDCDLPALRLVLETLRTNVPNEPPLRIEHWYCDGHYWTLRRAFAAYYGAPDHPDLAKDGAAQEPPVDFVDAD